MRRRRAIGWLIALVVVVGVLVAADRISAAVASNTAEHYLAEQAAFQQSPSVSIDGFPFLTQAIEGRYREVQIRSGPFTFDGVQAIALSANLLGVHLPLSAVFGGAVTSLPVDSVSGSVSFGYAQLAQLSGVPHLAIVDQGGQLHVSATLTIPGTNTTVPVSGAGTVGVVDATLRLSVTQLSAAGVAIPSSVLAALEASLAVPIPIPTLPYGLRIIGVSLGPEGAAVVAAATDVVITRTT